TRNGSTENMGTNFKLVRTGSGDSCGIKIAEAYTASNLYPGDLQFLVRDGVPYVICHVFVEDYLYGVVPYEMSNTFPLEALKAQAVTARTYALRRMASASGNYYDLRDTTSDQVYRGTPGGYSSSKDAVDGTAGQVLMYGSDYCVVYYSSSNGGQTESAEHAWGGSGSVYLSLKDDPYDLANPSATVRQATIYSTFTNNSAVLQSLLAQRLSAQQGVSASITTIESVTPESPRYALPSRLYTQMRFMLRCNNGQAYAVTVPIFGTLDGTLGLSMSGLQNELFTVATTSAGFRIMARRYGHGVGLSQYGASQMASEGMNYLTILGFYFNGATLVQHNFIHEDGTVTPTASPTATTPGTGLGQATVVLSNPNNNLNLRSQPNTKATVLAGIPNGAVVTVYAVNDGWAQVRYGGLSGYVSTAFLQFGTTGPTAAPNMNTAVVALASGSLNLRARESVTADRLTSI
ncbi:MAG TPA: SpoIID/LytB domain-containing protein, partial [Clostridia bacterium]|nr:SpoIID/LytB domain-containing protein [Clostridia bacterium]